MVTPAASQEKLLYQEVAGKVRGMILGRTYRPGDRLPSVRDLSRQMRVSVTTVLEAYRLLEDQGLIHPRPKSGYFVRARAVHVAEPPRSMPAPVVSVFDCDELVHSMAQQVESPGFCHMALALPNPDLLPHARLSRLIGQIAREHPEATYGYSPVSGHRVLREQIAQRAFAAGAVVSPDEIVITTGCQDALCLTLKSIGKPGGIVLVESPFHYGILQAVQLAGMRSLEVSTRTREGVHLEALEEAAKLPDVVAAIVSPNYQNPLGSLMSDADKAELVSIANRTGLILLEDDVYGDLGFQEDRPRLLRSFEGSECVITVSSFSKTIAPGYRIGWVLGSKWHSQIERLKYVASIGDPGLQQLVVAAFLADGGYDQSLRRARKHYQQNVERMSEAIAYFFPKDTCATRPAGGFLLWVELDKGVDSLELYNRALQEKIALSPGYLFGVGDTYRHYIRLSAGVWSPQHESALEKLGKMLR